MILARTSGDDQLAAPLEERVESGVIARVAALQLL